MTPARHLLEPVPSAVSAALHSLGAALRYLAHVESLLVLGVLALLLSVLDWLGTLPGNLSLIAILLARLLWGTYFFLVLQQAARGNKRLPAPRAYLDNWDELIQPLLQVLVASTWLWGPLLLFADQRGGVMDFIARFQAHPLLYLTQQGLGGQLLLAWCLLYLPLALLASVSQRRVLRMLDPTLGLRLVWRVRWEYAATFAAIALLGILGSVLAEGGRLGEAALPVPLAAPVLGYLLHLWVPLVQARLLGDFIHRQVLSPR